MKTCLFILFNLLLACSASAQPLRDKLTIAFYGDYLQEDLRWSIAGNSSGQNPNVLSEVRWKALKQRGAGLDLKIDIWSGFFFSGNYHRANIYSGSATDTDYGQDNRTAPTYQSIVRSDEGHTYSYYAGLGYRFEINSVVISPYAGYSKNRQFLFLSGDAVQDGEKQLNSTYQTSWNGPRIGLDAHAAVKNWLSVKAGLSYTQSDYTGAADWNLIDAFAHPVSFKHNANGYQTNMNLQVNFQLIPKLSAFIRGNYTHSETGTGTDQLFLIDGRTLQSQFNGAVSNNKGIGIGICYHPIP